MSCQILHGDCRNVLPTIGDATIDAIITDPPYELGFMGKRWDATGIAYDLTVWRECLRVLKPGGHLLAFGGTRTYHRMVVAIEDAGFEIRDSIHWLYGSGFPKSMDVSKAIDKAAGKERPVIGTKKTLPGLHRSKSGDHFTDDAWRGDDTTARNITAPATDAARQWDGWGTALKPAHEPIIVARKPLDGTVAANVLAYGTGALNIDGCRIEGTDTTTRHNSSSSYMTGSIGQVQPVGERYTTGSTLGRWPANVVIDPHIAEQHPEWANYYYCPKASTAERNTGLNGLPEQMRLTMSGGHWVDQNGVVKNRPQPSANTHPTVKPLNLMRWLCRLVTPPGGLILDPFAGSGTTLTAAILEHFNTIGIELTDEYHPIIQARTSWAQTHIDGQLPL